ncbi:hypothetical protein LOSG293_190050 [Secundilactobacillus oryzae JCM 18671]|uniref:Uncharacterized protein n=1 Tax=Secundilactobacillus oryzae JCM 18671 TaxID=1291743 RepID=A0A081BJ80_9LACO|nr:hypothetical protein [Secundilactobacillus oryzae]GAK48098.1 hypothetical protein LOSG293_190050 [Secundilactobacillus oryzae JCM 18671]
MDNFLKRVAQTAIEAYQKNEVITVDYLTDSATASLTGLVNFVSNNDYFYLTRHGEVTRIDFEDVQNIDFLHQQWWQVQLQNN